MFREEEGEMAGEGRESVDDAAVVCFLETAVFFLASGGSWDLEGMQHTHLHQCMHLYQLNDSISGRNVLDSAFFSLPHR